MSVTPPPPALTPELIRAYNATRRTQDPSVLCHFPSTTLNFEQTGRVTACCYNRAHVLGWYPEQSVEAIWSGERAEALRRHLRNHDLSHGCDDCVRQIVSRNFHGTLARGADEYASVGAAGRAAHAGSGARREPALPKVFEFEISNTCNLECIMCSGHFSSAIRSRREKLPRLESPYDDAFVRQLVPFLPHLRLARFLGGEPFLIGRYHDIRDQVLRHNPALDVTITTNATVLNARTKQMLERLHCTIVVSMDSFVKPTYEHIRAGACFEDVLENVAYLRALVRRKRTSLSFAVCPMTVNWRELAHIVHHCNTYGDLVHFNTLTWPHDLSLRELTARELAEVHAGLARAELPRRTEVERRNAAAYQGVVNQVERWRDERSARDAGPTLLTRVAPCSD